VVCVDSVEEMKEKDSPSNNRVVSNVPHWWGIKGRDEGVGGLGGREGFWEMAWFGVRDDNYSTNETSMTC